MLTNQDLKNIGDLIDTKLEEKLESKLEEKLESKLEEKLESKFSPINSSIKNIQKDIKTIKQDIKKINKNMERDFGYHEKHHIHVATNVQQIQRHLGMPIMTIDPPDINSF